MRANAKYIVYLAINIPLLIFFVFFGKFTDGESATLNYNTTLSFTDYNLKIADAVYNTQTGEFSFTLYMGEKNSVITSASKPEFYSICDDTDLGKYMTYTMETVTPTAQRITTAEVVEDFKYVRLILQSKYPDKVVEDTYDEFGVLVEGYTVPSEFEYIKIYIDRRDVVFVSDESEIVSPIYTSFTTMNSQPSTSTSITESVKTTTTTEPTTTTTSTRLTTTTKEPTVTTTTTIKKQTTTTTVTTTKKPTTTTTTKKTTTTTTTTAKPKTTTTKKTTTTTTTTLVTAAVIPTGLKISCPVAVNGIVTLNVGGTAQLTADFTPDNVTDKSVIWSSRKPEVVTVDKNGKLTAVEKGTTTVSCETANGRFKVAIMVKVV